EMEHYMDPGFDAEGDDPAGADEEWRYFKKQVNSTETSAHREKSEQVDHPMEATRAADFDPDAVPNDEAAVTGDAIAAQTTYDRDNPEIVVESTFEDKGAFIDLIKQYAIKHEFETFVVHSDTTRYRAKCAD